MVENSVSTSISDSKQLQQLHHLHYSYLPDKLKNSYKNKKGQFCILLADKLSYRKKAGFYLNEREIIVGGRKNE